MKLSRKDWSRPEFLFAYGVLLLALLLLLWDVVVVGIPLCGPSKAG